MKNDISIILKENRRRNEALNTPYNPVKGIGCIGNRVKINATRFGEGEVHLPPSMLADPLFNVASTREQWVKLRCRHDFEYWCATCVTVKDKLSGKDVPFVLNAPQRRVAALLEGDRLADLPIRVIMLKARQWGGSTLTQMYMAWIQSVHRRNWHSLICAHVKDTAANIRGMYSKMLADYPPDYWEGDEPPKFRPYERSTNIREIAGRGCRVTVGSSENQEAVRGSDYAMAHLSETAFWSNSTTRAPDKFIRAVCGAIALVPYSLIVMESTANGVGNYFHTEWVRCKKGKGDKRAVMVPWYEIEMYRLAVRDPTALWQSLDDYERALWDKGLTLEMINWYHHKRREYPCHSMMQAEYPTDDIEAFVNTGHNIFPVEKIEALRSQCRRPRLVGEVVGKAPAGAAAISGTRFVPDPTGLLHVWSLPQPVDPRSSQSRYIVTVDIGGRSFNSDYSVVAVLDRAPLLAGGVPEIVAQWRGHIDHDMLTWKSAAIAAFYNNALLVFESNSLETEGNDPGCDTLFPLSKLKHVYPNLYRRRRLGQVSDALEKRIGFHTNRATKSLIITNLIAAVRDGGYVERCDEACNELTTYELKPNGSYGAKAGYHDDILMTRAIALYVASEMPVSRPEDYTALRNRPRW